MTSIMEDFSGDLRDISLTVGFELKKHVRRKRLAIAALLAAFLPSLIFIVLASLGSDFPSTADSFASTNLAFVNLLIIISGALFAGDAISSEHEKRTGLMLYPSPQRKNSILVGKYLAALIVTMSVTSIYYLITAAEIAGVYGAGEISLNFGKSYLISILYATSVVGILYLCSALMKRSIVSTLLGFFSLMMIMPIITRVLSLADIDPWFMVTHSAGLITDVFGLSGAFGGHGPGEGTTFTPEFGTGIAVMTAYAIASFIGGLTFANIKRTE